MSNYYRKEIRKLLITYTVVFIAVSILLTLLFVGIYANRSLKKKNISANQAITKTLTQELQLYQKNINTLSVDQRVIDFLIQQKNPEAIYEMLYDMNNAQNIRSIFYIVDPAGDTLITNNYNNSPYNGTEIFLSGIFKEMKQSSDIAFASNKVQIDLSKRTILSLGKRIEQDGKIVGYMICDLLEQDVISIIETYGIDVFVLIDTYYNSIATNNSSMLDEIGKLSIIKHQKEYVQFNDHKYFYERSALIQDKLWLVTFSRVGLVRELMVTSLLFMCLALLVMVVVVITLSDIVTRRRTELINQELSNRTKLATLKLLEAQFNPHFIFNTLETLKYLVQFDQEKSMDLIVHFAKLLRYSIHHNEKRICLVEDLDYIQSYLMIQKYRYGTRLTYTISYDEALKHIVVPKLILQPIIENCIVHGYTHKEKLHIDITISKHNNDLIMVVSDNGDGINEQRLKKINQLLRIDGDHSEGIGLYNVHKRISLLYGKGYGLKVRSKVMHGTRVTITVPIIGNTAQENKGGMYD